MTTEVMNIVAVILGPVCAVLITLWYQARKEKRDGKLRLFFTLMAHRKSMPPTQAFVEGLNLIDVIFAKSPRVLQLWHEYYDLLCSDPPTIALWEHKYIDMLTEMARDLRYAKLKQTDIEKFYKPVAHGTQQQMNEKIQVELLRVLENTFALITIERTKVEKAIKDKQSSSQGSRPTAPPQGGIS